MKLLILVLLGNLGILCRLVYLGRWVVSVCRTLDFAVQLVALWILAVLLLWIHVVYNKNRVILLVMSAFYAVEVASVLTILTFSFENFEGQLRPPNPSLQDFILAATSDTPLQRMCPASWAMSSTA